MLQHRLSFLQWMETRYSVGCSRHQISKSCRRFSLLPRIPLPRNTPVTDHHLHRDQTTSRTHLYSLDTPRTKARLGRPLLECKCTKMKWKHFTRLKLRCRISFSPSASPETWTFSLHARPTTKLRVATKMHKITQYSCDGANCFNSLKF